MSHRTAQEAAWAGAFGDSYVERNRSADILPSKLHLLARLLARTGQVGSVLELGANVGLNLQALRALLPKAELAGIEINASAYAELAGRPDVTAYHGSFLDIEIDRPFDLVFTMGVLIHVAPDKLPALYDRMASLSSRYVGIIEYYNPTPLKMPYRGQDDLLFKRDFAGEFLDRNPMFRVVDYGFAWRRDPAFPLDDLTWFLLEKQPARD